ncbi:EAL domain-containing protein [Lysinibacillus macroides]|uniref:Diguanylate cyclase n=1 Tax=Lysinibacillus macroides TaxID=33935 RepID=A0A0N0CW59_9BACI|nr:GGDEF and EAL domain-containing protein [Lysinibacillus macroides]KOY82467.1 diguanylate cyclase [Lysinibacillus macroides]QPR66490.1 EAL domain-containing protein [Lysinibacillus macroides]
MKNYRESVAPFADYRQLIQLNPFDAVVCLRKVDTNVFEVVEFNEKLPLFMELQDDTATAAEHFFTQQCWKQLSKILNEDANQQAILQVGTDLQEKNFTIHVQSFSTSMIAVIFREVHYTVQPYLQFVEQHIDPVLTTDLQGRIIHQNMTVASLLGREQHSLLGRDIFSLLEGKYFKEFKLLFAKTIEGSAFSMPKCLFKGQLLSKKPFYLRTYPTYFNGKVIGVHLFVKDADLFGNDHETFYHLALMDELTGIWNRKALKEHWLQHLQDKRQDQKQAALILVDIDRFKKFNEFLGENKGDELMRMFCHRLQELCYAQCALYRYNSDEFIFVVKDASIQKIERTANAILETLKQPFMVDGQEYFISVSIGIALSPADGKDLETLVRKADQALFSVKEHGRSHYRYYREDMTTIFPNEALMEAHLRRAIEFNELSLHLQPQMDLMSNSINSFEALLRWNNRKFGFVSPAQFIPIAEASGLIIEIGDWIIDEVCRYQREWQLKGYRPVRVAVNISPKQFRKENFARKIKATLQKYEVPPELLEVEITESSMTNVHETFSILTELKQLGVYVSVDDFGTGYSSLSYLKRYPIDIIKIDQSFIADIAKDDKNEAIIKAIISMSHNLGLEVVAEGIEEPTQVDFLKRHHCQKGQGYLYNKPLPVDIIEQQYFVS